ARFPKIAVAVAGLPVQSSVIDGEAVVVDRQGLSVFDLLRYRHYDHAAVLCAFDLIELDGYDLRQQPLEARKDTLADLLRKPGDGIALTSTSKVRMRPSSSTPALSAARALYRSASIPTIARAGWTIGSRLRTRRCLQ